MPPTWTVTHLIDGVVKTDVIEGEEGDSKIHKDGRGFVHVDGDYLLYRRVEKIVVAQ